MEYASFKRVVAGQTSMFVTVPARYVSGDVVVTVVRPDSWLVGRPAYATFTKKPGARINTSVKITLPKHDMQSIGVSGRDIVWIRVAEHDAPVPPAPYIAKAYTAERYGSRAAIFIAKSLVRLLATYTPGVDPAKPSLRARVRSGDRYEELVPELRARRRDYALVLPVEKIRVGDKIHVVITAT